MPALTNCDKRHRRSAAQDKHCQLHKNFVRWIALVCRNVSTDSWNANGAQKGRHCNAAPNKHCKRYIKQITLDIRLRYIRSTVNVASCFWWSPFTGFVVALPLSIDFQSTDLTAATWLHWLDLSGGLNNKSWLSLALVSRVTRPKIIWMPHHASDELPWVQTKSRCFFPRHCLAG